MTWSEYAPGAWVAHGVGCSVRLTLVRPEDPYRWIIAIDWGDGFHGHAQFSGTLEAAQVSVLDFLHRLGRNIATDAAALAASMHRQYAPEVG